LAGAGSGKTKVLVHKIAHLLEKGYASVDSILAVTFTNKAANEMKERIAFLLKRTLGHRLQLPWMGTFHAICLKILKANAKNLGINPQFVIYDTADQLDTVKEAFKRLEFNDKNINPRAVLSYISSAKNELVTPEAYQKYASGYFLEKVSQVYPVYQKILEDNSAMDFDDLIMKTVKLFEQHEEVLKKFQQIFKFILIDEYQDTNHAQYIFTKLLSEKHRNICVVGDDAQSIYGFRGANIQNILNFERDYPNTKVIKLEQNYRSTKKILEASNAVIRLNKNQKLKTMWTENALGEGITLYQALNEKDEALWIGNKIKDLLDTGKNPDEIVILYRTNAQSRSLEEAFLKLNIRYKIVGNVRFYERKEVKDVLAYLRLLSNPADNVSLKRVINVPRRGIGPKTLSELTKLAVKEKKSVLAFLQGLDPEQLYTFGRGVAEFCELLNELKDYTQTATVAMLIDLLLEASGYKKLLDDGTEENLARLENIQELKTVARKFDSLPPRIGLERFLEEVALIEQDIEDLENTNDKVTLMTIHASKGLEFSYVFIAGMEEGIFPHSRSFLDPGEMEEERRLAYVALTRAKSKLFLTYTESRTFFGSFTSNPVSRFVTDIPENLVELAESESFYSGSLESLSDFTDAAQEAVLPDFHIGDKVRHEKFGIGTISDIDDTIITVNFPQGEKELSLEYARLDKV
ncbi:MAG TPA: UvrD-helicase domain-containing protein, partial [Candidatus Dojkabacteria bacterium]|nr:UvrD-helicase domain-containing protein [Candidatus Dojkabacteria bacterium]